MIRTAFVLLALAASPPAAAQGDAWCCGWSLDLQPGRGAYRLELPDAAYARSVDPGLADVAVFDADGRELPFGPVPADDTRARPPMEESRLVLPHFVLPEPAVEDAGDALSLRIARDADGRLRQLEADVAPQGEPTAKWLLIDASGADRRIDELELAWEPVGGEFSARFAVEGSDDLEYWTPVDDQVTVFDLAREGRSLRRNRIELPASRWSYLRLRRLDEGAPLAVTAITAVFRWTLPPDVEPPQRRWSRPTPIAVRGEPPAWEFTAMGPLPADRLRLELPYGVSTAQLVVFSRDAEDAPWQRRGELTAFRLDVDGATLDHDDLAIALTRDRHWRVLATPPLTQPPVLELGWYADHYVLIEQGRPPYRLVAGSGSATRGEFPIRALLGELRARLGPEWVPADAWIGVEQELGGELARLPPPPPRPVLAWVLWAVLVVAATAVLLMVFRLLRNPPPAAP